MKQPKETPSFYAIIPADVRYSDRLCMGAKLLYGEITALTQREGFCWASNTYFAELYSKDTNTVSRWIKELVEAGFIHSEIAQKEGNSRKIYLSTKMPEAIPKNKVTPIPENVVTPIPKNGEHIKTGLLVHSITTNKGVELSPEESLKERKTKFFNELNNWRSAHRGKYPGEVFNKFFDYWTETTEVKGCLVMRKEDKKYKYFEIGKRLATFWSFVSSEERQRMNNADEEMAKQKPKNNELNFGSYVQKIN